MVSERLLGGQAAGAREEGDLSIWLPIRVAIGVVFWRLFDGQAGRASFSWP